MRPLARPHHWGEDDGAHNVEDKEGHNQDCNSAEVNAGNGSWYAIKPRDQILN